MYRLSLINFLCKGWEVSLLILLAFIQKEFHLSLLQIGILGMVMTIAQILTTFAVGFLPSQLSRKRLVSLTLLLYGTSWLCLLFAGNLWMLLLAYGIGGIGSGIYEPMGNSLSAQLAHAKKRSEGIGNVEAFGDLGRIGISAITTWIVVLVTWRSLATLFGITSLVLFFLFFFGTRYPKQEKVISSKKKLLTFFHQPKFTLALVGGVLDSFASSSLYIFIPFLLTAKHIPLSAAGFAMTLFFIGYLSGRIFLGRIADRHGIAGMFIFADIAMSFVTIVLVLIPASALLYLLLFLLGVFTRGTSPLIKAMVAEALEKKEHFDKGYSVYSVASRSSSIASRPVLGFAASALGIAAAFYTATGVALLATIPAYYFQKIKRK